LQISVGLQELRKNVCSHYTNFRSPLSCEIPISWSCRQILKMKVNLASTQ